MKTFRLAHLSDPHFGTILPGVRERLAEALHKFGPDLVVISGDITQRARRWQFAEARRFKDELQPIRAFAVPGNHDIPLFNLPLRLWDPYRAFYSVFQSRTETDLQMGPIRVVGLNSTSRWRHVQGSLKLSRIRPKLLESGDGASVRIVAVHHPLDCSKAIDEKNLLRGGPETVELFAEAKVDLVLSGHIHDPGVTLSTGRYSKRFRPMIFSVAGTSLSWRTRKGAPNSFHQIEITTGEQIQLSITRMDLDPSQGFQPHSPPQKFTRQADLWTPT